MIQALITTTVTMAATIAADYWWAVAVYAILPFAFIRPVDHASDKAIAMRALVRR
jgi:hypothetical protein